MKEVRYNYSTKFRKSSGRNQDARAQITVYRNVRVSIATKCASAVDTTN